ncbi:MAG: hypothetical protein JWO94_3775 [Verrucomicrobiaceae bacterium]|nr:hypothetical protein [Verrucomicrobiaceae bacterium]
MRNNETALPPRCYSNIPFVIRPSSFFLPPLMKSSLVLLAVVLAAPLRGLAAEPVTAAARHLNEVFDGMHVQEHWIAGAIVDWRTGDPTGKAVVDEGKHTHCSQFAAAACDKLGIYLLHPPEHSSVLLANAQFDWLPNQGNARGWTPVPDGAAAQDHANKGEVVVAIYKSADPKKSGHVAIVRPGEKTAAEIAKAGPEVIQAGGHNYEHATLKQGFANHPDGFPKGLIRFYAHPQVK